MGSEMCIRDRLKKELSCLGFKFETSSDTEVLLNAWTKWGKDCINKFRGMFAFGIYDKTKQVLIAVSGGVTVICDDGENRRNYVLNRPNEALLIPEMIWDEQVYHTKSSMLLVLSNTNYDVNDYIEDYGEFKKINKHIAQNRIRKTEVITISGKICVTKKSHLPVPVCSSKGISTKIFRRALRSIMIMKNAQTMIMNKIRK